MPKLVHNSPIAVHTHDRAAMVKIIGKRLKEARELCGISQIEAARRLGMGNSTLSKAESGMRSDGGDAETVSVDLIYAAAKVYEVSVDFLFGRSDEWDIAEPKTRERDVSEWLFEAWEKERKRDIGVLRRLHVQFEEVDRATRIMLDAVQEVDVAMGRVRFLNPQFDNEIVAGSRLLAAIEAARKAVNVSKMRMARFTQECRAGAAGSASQLSLSLVGGVDFRPVPVGDLRAGVGDGG